MVTPNRGPVWANEVKCSSVLVCFCTEKVLTLNWVKHLPVSCFSLHPLAALWRFLHFQDFFQINLTACVIWIAPMFYSTAFYFEVFIGFKVIHVFFLCIWNHSIIFVSISACFLRMLLYVFDYKTYFYGISYIIVLIFTGSVYMTTFKGALCSFGGGLLIRGIFYAN